MTKPLVTPISSKGQVTLPKAVREALHVADGDYVRFEQAADGVLLTKVTLEREGFSAQEWAALERAANQRGKQYKNAKTFLRDLERP